MSNQNHESQIAVELRNVTRRFGAVTALDSVSFSVEEGSVTALLGENGAGKSTLLKILAGLQPPSEGEVYVFGRRVDEFTPNSVLSKHSVAIVPQELSLLPHRTVAENILVGIEPGSRLFPNRRKLNARARQLLSQMKLDIDPEASAGSLDMATQQLVAVARAVAQECKVLILDEPTSILTPSESTRLFSLIHDLHASGTTILYVSHRMPEIFSLTDQIEVLRDGKHVKSARTSEISQEAAVAAMVGRELDNFERQSSATAPGEASPALEVKELTGARHTKVTFDIQPGEIVGVAGLPDSGRVEMISNLYGADASSGGTVRLLGKEYASRSPLRSVARGLAFLPGERKAQALLPDMTVGENIGVLRSRHFSAFGLHRRRSWMKEASDLARQWGVKTASIETPIRNLSGGNQQKALLARCLSIDPQVLILDEPTRGVDVGAKADIYGRISQVAERGVAVLCSSSDLPELIAISDRIIVMSQGEIAGVLAQRDASEEQIMALATRSTVQDQLQGEE